MSDLYEEIKAHYLDADGLVSPSPCSPTERNASDNGTLFLAELMVLLKLRGELEDTHCEHYLAAIQRCFKDGLYGLLYRSPVNDSQDGPDDMLGLAAGALATGNSFLAQTVLDYGWQHPGFFNNENPGNFKTKDGSRINWSAFLWRQPQLIAALTYAAGQTPNVFLRIAAAVSLFISCRNVPFGQTDPYRLAWLLAYCTQQSWMCRMATRVWFGRLEKEYGSMGVVRALYYHGVGTELHPIAKWSVDSVTDPEVR